MKNIYRSEISKELAKGSGTDSGVITEQDLTPLPEPVQRFFRHCGYLGHSKIRNAEITWRNVNFKMSPKKKWMPLQCAQFNSVPEPCRMAYMKSKMLGLIPVEGRDKYQDGRGNMKFKLCKFFPVVDASGPELDQSALVTVLAECLLVPGYALQDYIQWSPIDSHTAKAVLKHNNLAVSGSFTFNDLGEFICFTTNDRYYTERGNEYRCYKWSAVAGSYVEKDGIRFPSFLKSLWHLEIGEYEYFKGEITAIRFNIP